MSDLGQILISISDKLSKLISRSNKLERNIYKIARSIIPTSIAVGDLPVKQLDTTECFVEPCPILKCESEFRTCKMIPVIHSDKLIDKTQIFSIDASTQATNNSNADSNFTYEKPLELGSL